VWCERSLCRAVPNGVLASQKTMGLSHTRFRPVAALAIAVFATAVVTAPARPARADNVSPTGKGIAGGALLGGEVVTMVESIAGVRSGWAYGVGALVGAGGGGVGGYFVEKGSGDGKAPMYMLAGGLFLLIPAVVLTLNATRYLPDEGATEDRAPTYPAAEPGVPGEGVTVPPGGAAAPATPAPPAPPAGSASPPQSMLDMQLDTNRASLRIGLPTVDVRPVFTLAEVRQYGMRAETEVRLALLSVAF
jgi:hypothetical protein